MHPYRTHTCGELRKKDVGQRIRIAGWIQDIRDLGGVLFMTLRDTYGITQVIIPSENKALQQKFLDIQRESTVTVLGEVLARPDTMINPQMITGEIEISATDITALGKVRELLPFEVWPDHPVNDELRLKNRFLDLRKERLHNNLKKRADIIASIRKRMRDENFIEIQTPILTSSSPEGARDFLVPSRIHPGKFYALPQAPQQFKQLIMVSGFDRYFQIAPCFRDEDARADRSPGEFYQLDMEMAFATQEDVFAVIEKMLHGLFKEFSDWTTTDAPFPRIPFKEAMLKFGTDKPDLRNPLRIHDVSDLFVDSSFKVFAGKTIRAIQAPGCGKKPRSFFDKLSEFTIKCGGKGLAYLKVDDKGVFSGPILKFVPPKIQEALKERLGVEALAGLFFVADPSEETSAKVAGLVRTELGQKLDLLEKEVYKFCWIVDFPMYERDPETQKIDFSHNPFSMPQGGLDALNNKDPLSIFAYQYDIVVNGVELSSGAVRNHDPDVMVRAFEIAGYDENEVKLRFPALFNAFQFGAPPHAGIAPGIDRIVMLLLNEPNIREVIAFPMNTRAQDLLMNAPNAINEEQLKEVHIKMIPKAKKEAVDKKE